jgi:hypothetical protein
MNDLRRNAPRQGNQSIQLADRSPMYFQYISPREIPPVIDDEG